MSGMFDFMQDAGNYADRKVAEKIEVNGLTVSTCWTSDEGYETAIIDWNGTYPVERYDTKEQALAGHEKWGKKAISLKEVTMLGWLDDTVEPEVVRLTRAPIDGEVVETPQKLLQS